MTIYDTTVSFLETVVIMGYNGRKRISNITYKASDRLGYASHYTMIKPVIKFGKYIFISFYE